MPLRFRFDGDLVELVIAGRLPLGDIPSGFRAMFDDHRFSEAAMLLINVSTSDTLPPAEVMQQLADLICTHRKARSARVAIVVADQVRYGLARQLSTRLENGGITAQPFHEHAAAVEWLRNGDADA